MGDGTKIEWTEATWNVVTGCSLASPGCTNCYAMKLAGTRLRHHPSRAGLTRESKAGPVWTGEVRFNKQWLDQPLRWKRPRMIFVCAHGDLFHESVPDEWIDKVFAVMALAPQHVFRVLTKRSARMRQYMTERWQGTTEQWVDAGVGDPIHVPAGPETGRDYQVSMAAEELVDEFELADTSKNHLWTEDGLLKIMQWKWPLPNVWLGVSVEDQPRADERRDDFANTPASIKFVSYEPALGPVDWNGWVFVDQIISGGESGPKARPAHPDWFRATRDWCADYDVAYFHKQNGEFAPGEIAGYFLNPDKEAEGLSLSDAKWEPVWSHPEGHYDDEPDVYRLGKKRAGRLLDGIEHNGMPDHG